MAGFREFLTGEVLTAANVNNFLMKQSVMVFADDAARTAALGAEVAEGMLTYNEDTAQLEVFDGTNFVVAAPAPTSLNASVITAGTLNKDRLHFRIATGSVSIGAGTTTITFAAGSFTAAPIVVANGTNSTGFVAISGTVNSSGFACISRDFAGTIIANTIVFHAVQIL